jgi:threonine dehydrogenase-like Zn-dependent dehydrogenase
MTNFEKFKTDFTDYKIPPTMQALVLKGQGFENLAIEQVPVPKPGPKQLLARVDAAGVCTSILKIIAQAQDHKYLNGWDPSQWPLILGDEGSLTIVAVGEHLQNQYQIGQRYGIQPAVDVGPINHCERYHNNGAGMTKTAVGYTLGGQLAEYILVQEEVITGGCLVALPQADMPYFATSMAEPISCVVSAQTRQVHLYKDSPQEPRYAKLGIKQGGTCLVIGAGGMGKIHVELAMRFKPQNLIVIDPIAERLQWVDKVLGPKAQERGINLLTVIPDEADALIHKVSKGRLADDIIMAVGIKPVQQNALNWLGFGGVANAFGGLKKDDAILEVDGVRVHYDEIKIVGSSGGDPADYLQTLEAIQNQDIDPGNYVAGVGSLDNAIQVLQMIQENKVQGKVILYPHTIPQPLQMVDYWDQTLEDEYLKQNLKI